VRIQQSAPATGGESLSHIVTAALSQYLNKPIHTLFQVSTSGALVAGIYSGAVSSGPILQHGDFGLGAFENLDGEMVILDGSGDRDVPRLDLEGAQSSKRKAFRSAQNLSSG
jgi:hypothetical protein